MRKASSGLAVAVGLFLAALPLAGPSPSVAVTVTDISPFVRPQASPPLSGMSISGKMTAVAVSADGYRVYAASTNAGLWRSVDSGSTWCQLSSVPVNSTICPDDLASAIPVPVVADIAVSPVPSSGMVVLAAAAFDGRAESLAGIYRSEDGGGTWRRVHEFTCGGTVKEALQVRFAPDDPNAVYASGGCSVAKSLDGGVTWHDVSPGAHVHASGSTGVLGDVPINYLAVSERLVIEGSRTGRTAHRWVYACSPNGLFYSRDEGQTWRLEDRYPVLMCGGYAGTPHRIATEPGRPSRLYVARDSGPKIAPIFFDPGDPANNRPPFPDGSQCTFCGEGVLWYASFDNFHNPAAPVQLSSPPVYWGAGAGSGTSFVLTAPNARGNFLVFFGDLDTVHVHEGPISTGYELNAGWHRLDGDDPWGFNFLNYLHVDPIGIAISPNFSITLVPVCSGDPYCGNTAPASASGKVWLANDGGIFASAVLDAYGPGPWNNPVVGLNTLAFNGAAVLTRPGALSGGALYTGTVDNDQFFYDPDTSLGFTGLRQCGDCNQYFADALQPDRVVHVDQERQPQFGLHKSSSGGYPPLTGSLASGHVSLNVLYPQLTGYDDKGVPGRYTASPSVSSPVIQTLPGEDLQIPNWGPVWIDLVKLGLDNTTSPPVPALFRNPIIAGNAQRVPQLGGTFPLYSAWSMILPLLPTGSGTPVEVQAADGHSATAYYVRTGTGTLFKGVVSAPGAVRSVSGWTQIAPSPCRIGAVQRFFVNPYNSAQIYAVDGGHICRGTVNPAGVRLSTDGGARWSTASSLTAALTNYDEYTVGCSLNLDGSGTRPDDPFNCLLNHILFVPNEPRTIFAAGMTGVFGSVDGGTTWTPYLDNAQLPCNAAMLGFDNVTSSSRTLYVFCFGRGALRLDGLPGP